MKKYLPALQRLPLAVIGTLAFSGCVKDDCKHTYKMYTPVYKTLSEIRSEVTYQGAQPLVNPGKIYLIGNQVYLGERGKGVHIIDNSNPRQPRNAGFIKIPGNIDIALKDDILYADLYCDLAAFDLSHAGAAPVKKYLTNAFPTQSSYGRYGVYQPTNTTNPDSIKVVVDWSSRDTVLSCDSYNWLSSCATCGVFFLGGPAAQSASAAASGTGKAGSMARFATVGDYLYALDYYSMGIISVANAADPTLVKRQSVPGASETIYPFNGNLFIGMTTGMSVFNISNPVNPTYLSMTMHWRGCDPVVTDGKYAYVTIFDGALCGGTTLNQLEVYDVSNLSGPTLQKTYRLTNPHGLSKEGNLLFICDGRDGLKIYDATDVKNLVLLKHISGINTYDLVTSNGIAYVVAKDGLYQYDYSHPAETRLISRIGWSKPLG